MLLAASIGPPRSAHVIVLGNEKGGSGKSTTCMHIVVGLLKAGQRVAPIDLDSRQKSLTHYIENSRAWAARPGLAPEIRRTTTWDAPKAREWRTTKPPSSPRSPRRSRRSST